MSPKISYGKFLDLTINVVKMLNFILSEPKMLRTVRIMVKGYKLKALVVLQHNFYYYYFFLFNFFV